MARKKTAPKRTVEDGGGGGGVSESTPPKRRRSSSGVKVRRRISSGVESNVPLLGPLRLSWSAPEAVISAQNIEVAHDLTATIDGIPVFVSPEVASQFCRRQQPFTFNSASTSELCLDVPLKILPLSNARCLVENIFGKDYSKYEQESELTDTAWGQFFKELEELQRSRLPLSVEVQHADLLPTLRGYQSAAVGWMIDRENIPSMLNLDWMEEVADSFTSRNGHPLLYNKYTQVLYNHIEPIAICSGGILADEMGLGKTVITLALILNNTRRDLPEWEMVGNPSIDDEEIETAKVPVNRNKEMTLERKRNQESCLDANEELQLVPNKPRGSGILRSKLTAWYESKLAEVSVRKSMSPVRRLPFKCTCGDAQKIPKNSIKCPCCGLRQHPTCGGYQREHSYICASCWRLQKPIPSKTTLIIAPPAIFKQWASELERHTPTLKFLLYSGVKDNFVQPFFLADHDVVITTYSVMGAETLYANDPSERCLRNEGRFLRASSPLQRVDWWRVVCDEAQMVESDVSLVRTMTNQLSAVHRWCVTGTPIQRGVSDLFYLTSFMGLGAFEDKKAWKDFLLQPYLAGCKRPLLSVLNQVFWRSTKEEVAVELNLPEQTFQRHFLKFTAIEETFYMQQHSASAQRFAEGLLKSGIDVNSTLDSLDKSTLKRLLQPLLNLRQACTHAQVVRGITINSASGASNLGELLVYLVKKTKQECEETLRRHVAALNGLAGLNFLLCNWVEAIALYREVFRLAEECKDGVQVDTLQQIHALTNAAEAFKICSDPVPPTLRDHSLLEDAEVLEKKYLSKSEEAFKTCLLSSETLSKELKTIWEGFETSPSSWWVPVTLALREEESELVDKLAEVLHSNDPTEKASCKLIIAKVSSLRGVEITISQWWNGVEKHHKTATAAMRSLINTPRNTLVEQALNCHLRTTEQKTRCELCRVENTLLDLECELFATKRKTLKKREKVLDGGETKGSWKPHSGERVLLTMFAFARTRCSLESYCLQDGKRHARLLEAMKKEFKNLRAVWTALNHRVHAEDELTMAKIRLRVAEPWEAKHRPNLLALTAPVVADTVHLVPAGEIPLMIKELTAERSTALSLFRKKQGRLFYLQNLGKDRNASPEPCPICKNHLEQQWCVLMCGHCLCISCLQMIHVGIARSVKCPICRESTDAADVGFVDIGSKSEKESEIEVVGDYSTKVDNIVREVLKQVQLNPAVKIIIFSTWVEVLKILGQALTTNQVKFLSLPTNKHQNVLQNFRDPAGGVTVLLLPFAWGSKGLNLIEATHVFLVEPILNSSEELQAIGRVHRIGQTKPTVVHRFVVKGTVEEKIFEVVSEAKDALSDKTTTLRDLQKLFTIRSRQTDVQTGEGAVTLS